MKTMTKAQRDRWKRLAQKANELSAEIVQHLDAVIDDGRYLDSKVELATAADKARRAGEIITYELRRDAALADELSRSV